MKPTFTAAAFAFLVALFLPGPAHAGSWSWPVRGEVITQYRNGDDPYAAGQHRGIDIAAPVGERVLAAAGGMVTFAGVAGSSGRTVSVRTADGHLDTSYLHLSTIVVREGDAVVAGDTLGAVGTSGRRSAEQPHLHFGVHEAGERHAYRDPLDFLGSPPPREAPREPAPAPAPSGAPAEPRPAPAPGHTPKAAPARAADVAAHPVFGPDPFARLAPALIGPGERAASRAVAAGAARAAGPRHVPSLGPAPAEARQRPRAEAPRQPAATTGSPAGRAGKDGGGVDLGWLAACLGLLAAATALGRAAKAPRADAGRARRPRRSAPARLGRATALVGDPGATTRPE